ncbi:DUF2169 domain-containing protein [Salmonella enterica subsp. enterica]|nr:DUF2169 domain-containing protein [Salmonella enterica subsp. enterica]
MEIINGARHTVADIATVLDKTGREHLVIVIKATYCIPANNKPPRPQVPPQPLSMSDIFVGEPGLSAPLYEADFVRYKAKCDVLFNATAHVPQGRAVTELNVFVRVGTMQKNIHIVGNRQWQTNAPHNSTEPEVFTEMPLHYGHAFGGIRSWQENNETKIEAIEQNLVGMGYNSPASLDGGINLPNLEMNNNPIIRSDEKYEPIALSAIARNWLPRRMYAGTYDERWRKEVFPFLPTDFDEHYFQCAPIDQQIQYPRGGEKVILKNIMKGREEVRFILPRLDNIPVKILTSDYEVHTPPVVVDTLYFEPDKTCFSVVWRTSVPIKQRIQDFQTIAIGHVCKNWWETRTTGGSICSGCAGEPHGSDPVPENYPNASSNNDQGIDI